MQCAFMSSPLGTDRLLRPRGGGGGRCFLRGGNFFNAVAIRTAPVRRLVFAICTGVRRFHRISL